MKITTVTRITLDRNQDKQRFQDLMNDEDWIVYESFGDGLVTFEKISEVIIV